MGLCLFFWHRYFDISNLLCSSLYFEIFLDYFYHRIVFPLSFNNCCYQFHLSCLSIILDSFLSSVYNLWFSLALFWNSHPPISRLLSQFLISQKAFHFLTKQIKILYYVITVARYLQINILHILFYGKIIFCYYKLVFILQIALSLFKSYCLNPFESLSLILNSLSPSLPSLFNVYTFSSFHPFIWVSSFLFLYRFLSLNIFLF